MLGFFVSYTSALRKSRNQMALKHLQQHECTRLPTVAKMTLFAFAYLADDNGACSPNIGKLCLITCLPAHVVRKAISDLREGNLITVATHPAGFPVYTLTGIAT
jgi:hypothetical protein